MYIDISVIIFVSVLLAALAITLLLKLFELRDTYEALEDTRNCLRDKTLKYQALLQEKVDTQLCPNNSAIKESVIKIETVSSQILPVKARLIIPIDMVLKGEPSEEYIRSRLVEQIAKSITDYVDIRAERNELECVQYTASVRILSKEEE